MLVNLDRTRADAIERAREDLDLLKRAVVKAENTLTALEEGRAGIWTNLQLPSSTVINAVRSSDHVLQLVKLEESLS